jgi:hypothetical protein
MMTMAARVKAKAAMKVPTPRDLRMGRLDVADAGLHLLVGRLGLVGMGGSFKLRLPASGALGVPRPEGAAGEDEGGEAGEGPEHWRHPISAA